MGLMFGLYLTLTSERLTSITSDVINWVKDEHEIMSDEGFSIQDFCRIKYVF